MRNLRLALLLIAVALSAACAGPKRLPPATDGPVPWFPSRAATDGPLLLGVGLVEGQDAFTVVCDGAAEVRDAQGQRLLARLQAGAELVCRRDGAGVNWRAAGARGSASAILLLPRDPDHRARHGDDAYRGSFRILPTPTGGGLTLVNEVEIEAYLRGVVPWEIGRHDRDRLAALEAQAVAARTYTMSHLGRRAERGFDVVASVMDQVYRGAAGEDPLCNEAIDRTAGLVLRHDGVEINAYYSGCCGGVSSSIEEVWPRPAQSYLVSRPDEEKGSGPFCATSKYYRWEESWSRLRLEEILAETLPAYLKHMARPDRAEWAGPTFSPRGGAGDPDRPGRLHDLEILRRTTSGRVAHLAVTTDAGTYHVRGDRLRWVLRPADGQPAILRSAFLDLDLDRRDGALHGVAARGRGYGHGIGMCQTGALEMARRGHDVRSILGHYYPGAVLGP